MKIRILLTFAVISIIALGFYSCSTSSNKDKNDSSQGETSSASLEVKITPEFIELINQYDQLSVFSEGFAAVKKNDKWGYINSQGKEIIPCIYDNVYKFSEGIACVKKDGKYGYINTKGKEITPLKYDEASYFIEGIATIYKNDKYGLINDKGEEITPCIFEKIGEFSEGLASVRVSGKYGYINPIGEIVIPCKYNYSANSFSEGKASVANSVGWVESYEYIDSMGNQSIPSTYSSAGPFIEGFAVVRYDRDGVFDFIDATGKSITDYNGYYSCYYFSDGLAGVGTRFKYSDDEISYGFINTKGEETIPLVYRNVRPFQEGLAAVCTTANEWGYITTTGRMSIPFSYDYAFSFYNGVAAVEKDFHLGFIDKKGNVIVPCIYDSPYEYYELYNDFEYFDKKDQERIDKNFFSNGVALVSKNGITGYVDQKGNDTFTGKNYDIRCKKKELEPDVNAGTEENY